MSDAIRAGIVEERERAREEWEDRDTRRLVGYIIDLRCRREKEALSAVRAMTTWFPYMKYQNFHSSKTLRLPSTSTFFVFPFILKPGSQSIRKSRSQSSTSG